MASGTSLRFTVEVAADQADKTLKAMTLAFNEAGTQARVAMSSMGKAARDAGGEVITLGDRIKQYTRDQRSEARTAGFFAQEIAHIVPVSNEAKTAIVGLGGALVGGAGLLSAIGAAVAVLGYVASAFRDVKEKAKEAEEQFKASGNAIREFAAKNLDATRKIIEQASGKQPSEILKEQAKEAQDLVDQKNRRIQAIEEKANRLEDGENWKHWQKRKADAKEAIDALIKQRNDLVDVVQKIRERAETTEGKETIEAERELRYKREDVAKQSAAEEVKIRMEAAREKQELDRKYSGPAQAADLAHAVAAVDAAAAEALRRLRIKREQDIASLEFDLAKVGGNELRIAQVDANQRIAIQARNVAIAKSDEERAHQQALLDVLIKLEEQRVRAIQVRQPDTSGEATAAGFMGIEAATFDPKAAAEAALRAQRDYNRAVRESAEEARRWGEAIGDVIGNLVTGQATVGQTFARIGQMIIRQVVQNAIAQITADAAATAAEGAKSQAGIPVIGPVLAISAMGALFSAVIGLLGKLPSAKSGWWDTGSYEGLAMVHKREMIADAPLANQIRRGAMGSGVTVNVSTLTASDLAREIARPSGPVAREFRKAQRRTGA